MAAAGVALGFDLLMEVEQGGDGHFDAAGLGVDDRDVSALYPATQCGVRQAEQFSGHPSAYGRA